MSMPYHKRWHREALEQMQMLTLEERGAYTTLLDLIHQKGGPIIDNERRLAGLMGCSTRKWRIIRQSLIDQGKIFIVNGMISNEGAKRP